MSPIACTFESAPFPGLFVLNLNRNSSINVMGDWFFFQQYFNLEVHFDLSTSWITSPWRASTLWGNSQQVHNSTRLYIPTRPSNKQRLIDSIRTIIRTTIIQTTSRPYSIKASDHFDNLTTYQVPLSLSLHQRIVGYACRHLPAQY